MAQTASEAQFTLLQVAGDYTAGPLPARELRKLARNGIHLVPAKGPPPPLAFVFPGQGSQYPGMGKGLCEAVPAIRQWLDQSAGLAGFDLFQFLFSASDGELLNTRRLQPALFCLEYALARYLLSLGLRPAAVAGHSLGEFTALCVAGVFTFEDGLRLVSKRAQCMEHACSQCGDAGVMLAVNAPFEFIQQCVEKRQGLYISNINAPNQVVLAGGNEPIMILVQELRERQCRGTLLNVGMAFHSPIMSIIRHEFEAFLASIPFRPPRLPVISNTTAKPFPSDPEGIKKLVIAQLESPVQWADSIRYLWRDCSVRAFVEIGPGNVLTNLISETLTEVECMSTCVSSGEDAALKTAVARLYAHGCLEGGGAVTGRRVDEGTRGLADGGRGLREDKDAVDEAGNPQIPPHYIPVSPHLPVSASPSLPLSSAPSELVEELIAIIMEATGYERDEIGPDMDLREELAIRSSRLPVIMDAAERRFDITIQFEDFIGVRTVRDMAAQVSRLKASGRRRAVEGASSSSEAHRERGSRAGVAVEKEELKRVIFDEISLEMGRFLPVELTAGDSVAILAAGRSSRLSKELKGIFRWDYGMRTASVAFMKNSLDWGVRGFDIRREDEAQRAAAGLAEMPSLAGLVFVIDTSVDKRIAGPEDISKLLRGFFLLLQAFLKYCAGKFVFLVGRCKATGGLAEVLAEGALGMYLGAVPEYGSVQFRTLMLDGDTDLRYAIRCALDRSRPVVEMIFRSGEAFTTAGQLVPVTFTANPDFQLRSEDVVVLSGGGQGITSHLARALIPFGPRMILLGRTPLNTGVDCKPLPVPENPDKSNAHQVILQEGLTLPQGCTSAEKPQSGKALEIIRLMKELKDAGIEAEYHTCDVVDRKQVEALMAYTVGKYGRVDGIIHGAGVIRDGLLADLTAADFSVVADVKLLGAWNLLKTAERCGLRSFTMLSSVVAVQGNLGQTNYCAANRAATALVRRLSHTSEGVRCLSLLLPPIEGAGMADDPGIRQILRLRGMSEAYIHVNELRELFCRELLMAKPDDKPVLFMRTLPKASTARLDVTDPHLDSGILKLGATSFPKQDFPLIDSVLRSDIGMGTLEAHRTFYSDKDLWIEDHRPFKFLPRPLLSGVMVLEALMETARLLYPYLRVMGIQRAQFLERIECPSGTGRFTSISCRRIHSGGPHVICEASLSSQELPPSSNQRGRMGLCHRAHIVLSGLTETPWDDLPGFPVSPSELDTPPADFDRVMEIYREKSDFKGRYCVLSHLEGAGAEVIRGRTICREWKDFSHHAVTHYQYSPYLLEAVFHLVAYHTDLRNQGRTRPVVPFEIGELMLSRKADPGEEVLLEARMTGRNESGSLWNARCVDMRGRLLMQVRDLRMHWISG